MPAGIGDEAEPPKSLADQPATGEADAFDESWLDDLFGPIDAAASASEAAAKQQGGRGGGFDRFQQYGEEGAARHGRIGAVAYQPPPKPGLLDRVEECARQDGLSSNKGSDENAGLRGAIYARCRNNELKEVMRMVNKWQAKGAPVEDGVYSAGLLACERLGNWEKAATFLNLLEEYGYELVSEHFDAALRACDRHSRWQEALGLFDRMRKLGVRPSSRSFECTMRTAAKARQPSIVNMLWCEYKAELKREVEPLIPSSFTYNVIMRALAEDAGKARPSRRFARRVRRPCLSPSMRRSATVGVGPLLV